MNRGEHTPWNPGSRWFTDEEIDRAANEYIEGLDPKQYVGTRHHIVPRFILARFANDREQVYVRDRITGADGLRNIRDLAVRDFYTFIDQRGELNSSFESLLGEVERVAASVLRSHLDNPFTRARTFDDVERMAIDELVSLQAVRGHSHRRVGEILTDYLVKVTNRQHLSDQDLAEVEFVPHQNELLVTSMGLASKVHQQLETRACFLVTLDRPILITCDEPVLLEPEDGADGLAPTGGSPAFAGAGGPTSAFRDEPARPRSGGLSGAGAITMPLGPRHALVYDRPDSRRPVGHGRLAGDDARDFADAVAQYAARNAYTWLAAHPGHETFPTMTLPELGPSLLVHDGDTPMSERLRTAPRRKGRRLDKNARPHESTSTENS